MNQHLTDQTRQRYRARSLTAAELLAADDHLALCRPCRAELEAELEMPAPIPVSHLTYEDLTRCLSGKADSWMDEHLEMCPLCSADLEELRTLRHSIPARSWSRFLRPVPLGVVAALATILIMITTRKTSGPPLTLNIPAALEELRPQPGTLLGEQTAASFQVIEPYATLTTSRPLFRWTSFPGATSYRVSVFDAEFHGIASGEVDEGMSWTPPDPLPRGVVLNWRVEAFTADGVTSTPRPPAPEARFQVIPEAAEAEWRRIQVQHKDNPLRLGVEAANLGMRQRAVRLLGRVPEGKQFLDQLSW